MARPRRETSVLLDEAVCDLADIEQARADAANHRRLAAFHAARATKAESVIDGKVVRAVEAIALVRARHRRVVPLPPGQPDLKAA